MNVLALHLAKATDLPNACQLYRTNMPFHYLTQHGDIADWRFADDMAEDYARYGRQFLFDLAHAYDLVVFPRAVSPTPQHLDAIKSYIELFRRMGKRVVYECDDDLTNEYRDFSDKGMFNATLIASWCDAITVSTPYLADVMKKRTKRPVYVLPNMVEPVLWQHNADHVNGGLTIGLSGSETHYADWQVLKDVLPAILAANPHVTLALGAFHPDYLLDLPNTTYLPGMTYEVYAEFVRHCDIVLAPVDPADKFNLSKSPIKALEGMAATRTVEGRVSGAAVIATDNAVYRMAIEPGKTGLLVKHAPEAWQTAIQQLIDDAALRHRLQAAGHAWVWKHHNISDQWVRWRKAYQTICSRPSHTVRLFPAPIPA